MRLGTTDLASVGIYALCGSVFAGIYRVGSLWAARACGPQMTTSCESISHDTILSPMMYRLEENFKRFDEVAFCRFCENVDHLVWFRLSLQQQNRYHVTAKEIYSYFASAKQACKNLRRRVDAECSIAQIALFDDVAEKVFVQLESHLLQVLKVYRY